jgi:hypothetical protein
MTRFGEELIDEALGTSSKRWALLLLAVAAGAAIALWLTGRSPAQAPEAEPPPKPTSADDEHAPTITATAATKLGSAFTGISRPPAVLERLPSPRALRKRESADPAD